MERRSFRRLKLRIGHKAAPRCIHSNGIKGVEHLCRNIFQNNLAGLAVLDFYGNQVLMNHAFARIIGYDDIQSGPFCRVKDGTQIISMVLDRPEWTALARQQGGVHEMELPARNGRKIRALASANMVRHGTDGTHVMLLTLVEALPLDKAHEKIQLHNVQLQQTVKSLETDLAATAADLEGARRLLLEANSNRDKVTGSVQILVDQINKFKGELERKMAHNFSLTIKPLIDLLKTSGLTPSQAHLVDMLDFNVRNMTSPFGAVLANEGTRLSPREIQICGMIRDGKDSREIAATCSLSYETVLLHRKNIRKKLGLKKVKQNLETFLKLNM